MGSASSSPNRDGSDDPWWPIENQDLSLNINVAPLQTMDGEMNSNRAVTESESIQLQNNSAQSERGNSVQASENLNLSETEEKNTKKMSENTGECDNVSVSANASTASHSSIEENDKFATTEDRRSQLKSSQSLDEFKEELRIKREMRKTAITELHNEVKNLRKQLADEKALNKILKAERNGTKKQEKLSDTVDDIEASSSSITLRTELADAQLALQDANSEILMLTDELNGTRKQVDSLKECVSVSKQMVEIRENQLTQLKAKLTEIESSLAEREVQMMSENLRQEYDRQLANIRNLRALYDERARVNAAERENLNRQLETSRAELATEVEKNTNLEEHIASLDSDLKNTSADLYSTREQLAYYKSDSKGMHEEMTVINQLFSQLLAGFSGRNDIDIDKLTHMLEDNRDLLNDMTSREFCKEGAAQLPKLLFDLVSEATDANNMKKEEESSSEASGEQKEVTHEETENKAPELSSAQDIIRNLPKVWKVLIELLNHQKIVPVDFKEDNEGEDCYKSVQTPTGPQMVLSVSKTYIKLKDLILEKKFLQKETHKLKNFNSHLEHRLDHQEKRLGAVTIELNKTWSLVGRMQRQHRQLHTHEQVLRYQLQQKRRLLNELKEELEYCRRKWNQAKEKNKESQSQWDSLRLEFTRRKEQDANTSAESGYSDGPVSEDEEENPPRPSTPKYETKRKGNKEKFLLKVDSSGKKGLRVHSVSPIRCARSLNLMRRNSESHITEFATETIEAATATIQPVEYTIEKIEHVAFNMEDIVRMGSPAQKLVSDKNNELVRITEPIVEISPKPAPSNVEKLIELKCSESARPKMCSELRKDNATKRNEAKPEESLEAMFMRLSGEPSTSSSEVDATSTEQEKAVDLAAMEKTDNERRAERASRFHKLEEQCKSLIAQVMRTSNKGDEPNRQTDNVQNRRLPVPQTPLRAVIGYISESEVASIMDKVKEVDKAGSSTESVITVQPKKTDEECLSERELEYTSRRAERLKRLEEEYQTFLSKMNKTKEKANNVNKQLDSLHQRYKSSSIDEDTDTDQEQRVSSTTDLVNCDVNASTTSTDSSQANIEKSSEISATIPQVDISTPTCSTASTSSPSIADTTIRELDYVSKKRDERLKGLEEESKALLNLLQKRKQRVSTFNSRLDSLKNSIENRTTTTEAVLNESSTAEASSDLTEETQVPSIADSEHNLETANEDSQDRTIDEPNDSIN